MPENFHKYFKKCNKSDVSSIYAALTNGESAPLRKTELCYRANNTKVNFLLIQMQSCCSRDIPSSTKKLMSKN